MQRECTTEETQQLLIEAFNEITAILKSIGHPNRLRILILLLPGPMSFQVLLEEMELKKSALANHLTNLVNRLMVEKIRHGTYQITEDGESFLKTLAATYRESETRRRKMEEAEQRYKLARSFLDRRK